MDIKTIDRKEYELLPFLKTLRQTFSKREEFLIATDVKDPHDLPFDLKYLLNKSSALNLPAVNYQSPFPIVVGALLVLAVIWLALALADRNYEFQLEREQNGTLRIKGSPKTKTKIK